MKTMEAILARRSIRKYTDKPLVREDLDILMQAAMAAPSAVARDPWYFHVIRNRSKLTALAEILPYGKMLNQAPAAVLVSGDLKKAHLGETGETGYLIQDCSAAVENILLAARERGIGSVWLGVYPQKDRMKGIRKLFGMDKSLVPVAVLALGYPGEERVPETRYDKTRIEWVD